MASKVVPQLLRIGISKESSIIRIIDDMTAQCNELLNSHDGDAIAPVGSESIEGKGPIATSILPINFPQPDSSSSAAANFDTCISPLAANFIICCIVLRQLPESLEVSHKSSITKAHVSKIASIASYLQDLIILHRTIISHLCSSQE